MMIKHRMLVYIYSFIAKHQTPATMVSSSKTLRINYSTVKIYRKNTCAPSVCGHSIPQDQLMTESHISMKHMFTVSC